MSALEQEIMEKFHQLDDVAQLRIRTLIERATEPPLATVTHEHWLEDAQALRAEMSQKYGIFPFSIATLIDEVREERLDELMDRY